MSGLARDRVGRLADPADHDVATGGSGFGVMAMIVACERGWVTRADVLARLSKALDCLERATCYHGLYPHFMHGDTGATKPFSRKDDGADLVETRVPVSGAPVRARLFRSRYVGGEAHSRPHHLPLERGGVGLVHPGQPNRAHLALEPDQRLRAEPSCPRLERVPHRLCAGRFCAALFDGRRSLSRRLGPEPSVRQSAQLRGRRASARTRLGRTALLHPLFLLRHRSARVERRLRRLLEAERRSHAHQLRLLRPQPAWVQGLRTELLGPHRRRLDQGL